MLIAVVNYTSGHFSHIAFFIAKGQFEQNLPVANFSKLLGPWFYGSTIVEAIKWKLS